jgi:hypothetical protein
MMFIEQSTNIIAVVTIQVLKMLMTCENHYPEIQPEKLQNLQERK